MYMETARRYAYIWGSEARFLFDKMVKAKSCSSLRVAPQFGPRVVL